MEKQDRYLAPKYLMKDHSPKNSESLMTCKCTTGCRTNTLGFTEACLCPENTCTNSKQWTKSSQKNKLCLNRVNEPRFCNF